MLISRLAGRRAWQRLWVPLTTALFILALAPAAFAKDRYVPAKQNKAKVRDVGWDASLSLGASALVADSRAWVGTADGTGIAFSVALNAGLDYIAGVHEWRNTLKISETLARTPAIDQFVKTADNLAFMSIYLYHFKSIEWLGPFARAKLDTSIFETDNVNGTDVTYSGPGTTPRRSARTLRLTDPFAPMSLSQTLGMFAQPINEKEFSLELKLGFTAKEIFADGQLAINSITTSGKADPDDANAPNLTQDLIKLKALKDVFQGGPAAGIFVKGTLVDGKVTYFGEVEAMVPVINNASSGESIGDLINLAMEAGVSFKLVSWASLDYSLKVIREPQLIDKFQVQNSLLLTLSYTLLKSEQK